MRGRRARVGAIGLQHLYAVAAEHPFTCLVISPELQAGRGRAHAVVDVADAHRGGGTVGTAALSSSERYSASMRSTLSSQS